MARLYPELGPAFDTDQMNEPERIAAYVGELRAYRPRGFSKLAREGDRIEKALWDDAESDRTDAWDHTDGFKDDCEALLTEYARRVARHDFIFFGTLGNGGDVGFWVNIEAAREEADIELAAGDSVPKGFTGLAVFITDHGNVAARRYSRGRMTRELFDLV